MSTALPPHHEDDAALLSEVLRCYKPHCRYLTSMTVQADGEMLRGTGSLAISESCYIDDTGHLNAVEAGICYNQMLYQLIATAVQHGLGAVFSTWTMDDFRRRQLPDILIARFTSAFHRPIDPRSFHGEFTVERATQRRLRAGADPMVSLETSFRFWDDAGGTAAGDARVAIVGS